jgi:multidrug efflux system membrane fusion protein
LDSAKAELLAKKAELVDREFEFNKVEGLMASGSATPDERVTARARLEATLASIAKSQAEVERAQLDLGFCRVTAPIHGRISRNLIDAGNIVTADATVLATIVNDDVIYAYFDASEREVLTLRSRGHRHRETGAGTASEPEPPPAYLALMTETGFPHEGAIDYVSPKLDVSTGTIQVRGRFPNPDGVLLAGLFVRVRVPVSEPYQALTVTERALASDQGQRYLLAVSAQNVVEYRPVQVGTLQDGLRVIGAGIAAEDWIIVSGIQRVRPGVTVTPNRTPMPTGPAVSSRAPSAPAPAPASQSEPAAKGGH